MAGQRDSNHDTLFHPAGKLVRIVRGSGTGDADHFQHLFCPLHGLFFAQIFMQHHRFRDLLTNSYHRVQGGHRVLENHGDIIAAHMLQFLFAHFQDFFPIQDDRSVGNHARRVRHQVQDGECGRCFTRAGFTHQPECTFLPDTERDAVDGAHDAVIRIKADNKVFYFQYIFHHFPLSASILDPWRHADRRPEGSGPER